MAEWSPRWPPPADEPERLAPVVPLRPAAAPSAPTTPSVPAAARLRVLLPATAALLLWVAASVVDGLPQLPGPLDGLALTAAAVSPLAVLAAIPLVALALRGRAWPLAAVAALATLVPWVFVLGYASPAQGGPPPAGDVRVDAMLLDADGGADAPSVVTAVARQPVDLLVVTGATGVLAHDVTAAGLDPRLRPRWASPPDAAGAGGTVVWSRYPVRTVESLAGVASPAVRLVLDTGRGALTVVAGQTSRGIPARWRADLAAFGQAAAGQGPVAVLGALDATPQQAAFRRLAAGGLTDAADALGRGPRPTWPSWSLPVLPLDHVLVGGGIGVRAAATLPVAGTGHRALVTSLAVPAAG